MTGALPSVSEPATDMPPALMRETLPVTAPRSRPSFSPALPVDGVESVPAVPPKLAVRLHVRVEVFDHAARRIHARRDAVVRRRGP